MNIIDRGYYILSEDEIVHILFEEEMTLNERKTKLTMI